MKYSDLKLRTPPHAFFAGVVAPVTVQYLRILRVHPDSDLFMAVALRSLQYKSPGGAEGGQLRIWPAGRTHRFLRPLATGLFAYGNVEHGNLFPWDITPEGFAVWSSIPYDLCDGPDCNLSGFREGDILPEKLCTDMYRHAVTRYAAHRAMDKCAEELLAFRSLLRALGLRP